MKKKPFPGQRYPGLGLAKEFIGSIKELALLSGCEALANTPLYFHNAYIYNANGSRYCNPEFQGLFSTLCADLQKYIQDPAIGLAIVSRAISQGSLIHIASGKRVKWISQDQFFPFSSSMKSVFGSKGEYFELTSMNTTTGVFDIDFEVPVLMTEEEWSNAISIQSIYTGPVS